MMESQKETPTPVGAAPGLEGCDKSISDLPVTDNIAVQGDREKAVNFLTNFKPDGPWVLTSIVPDGRTTTRTFMADQADIMSEWIASVTGYENVYFHVNGTGDKRLGKKATKEDIISSEWLHVDVDPAPGLDRQTILNRLHTHNPVPTVIIDSGGGFQAFWRLSETVDTTTEEGRAEIEDRNRALETALGADHCHNVDRIMRLPGTINLPNKKKVKLGRTKTPAVLVDADWERRYDLASFARAKSSGASAIVPVAVELEALPVLDRYKALIVQGEDPDEPDRYASRSEALWAVLCALARAKVPPEEIAAVVLDADYAISGHLLDQKNPQQSAERQIQRAIDMVASEFQALKGGGIVGNYHNTRLAIVKLGVTTEQDQFTLRCILGGHVMQSWAGEVSDDACFVLRDLIIRTFGFDPGKNNVFDAVQALCVENPIDVVADMLAALKWDGKLRLDDWLVRLMGAEDTPYVRAVGRLMLRGMVERARRPGCKFDYITVLEGSQGTGKSTALLILCGEDDWFSDERLLAQNDKARAELMQGVWVFELGELAGLKKADVDDLKAFASRGTDRFRPAYGRHVIVRPRRSILVGTTNDNSYLRDPTGERRYLPVATGAIDLEALAAERDQLLAEACAGDDPLMLPQELWAAAGKEQKARRQVHPWEDALANMQAEARWGGFDRCSSVWLLATVLGIEAGRQMRHHQTDLAAVMRALGWDGPKAVKVQQGDKAVRGYARPSEGPDLPFDPPF